jgi:hypothetical protein
MFSTRTSALARLRQPAELQEFAEEAPQVPVVCLRETNDLVGRDRVAVDAIQVAEDHSAERAGNETARGPRRARRQSPPGERDRRRVHTRSWVSDSAILPIRWRPIAAAAFGAATRGARRNCRC